MNIHRILFLLMQFGIMSLCAQKSIKGVVVTEDEKGKLSPVPYANVYWMDTNY